MISTLLTLFTRTLQASSRVAHINTWFFTNAYIYTFKLTNYLVFFSYITDSLKLNMIRVYSKQVNLSWLTVITVKCLLVLSLVVWL